MVRVRSRSLEMGPFDRSYTTSYSPSMRYLVSFARYNDLLVNKSRNFYTPPIFIAPAGGDPVGISWRCLMLIKLEWLGYRTVKKLWSYVKPFLSDTGTLRTDGRTDWRTNRFAISISRVSMLTRDKNSRVRRIHMSVTKFGVFSDPTRKLSALTPERGRRL